MIDLTKLSPINGQVIVLDDDKETKKGAIYLPDNVNDAKIISGVILAESDFLLEDGSWMKTGLKPGYHVVYSNHAGAGNVHELDGKIYRIIRWNEILAVETA